MHTTNNFVKCMMHVFPTITWHFGHICHILYYQSITWQDCTQKWYKQLNLLQWCNVLLFYTNPSNPSNIKYHIWGYFRGKKLRVGSLVLLWHVKNATVNIFTLKTNLIPLLFSVENIVDRWIINVLYFYNTETSSILHR